MTTTTRRANVGPKLEALATVVNARGSRYAVGTAMFRLQVRAARARASERRERQRGESGASASSARATFRLRVRAARE